MASRGTRCALVVPATQPTSTIGSSSWNSGYASASFPSRAPEERGAAYAAATSRCHLANACPGSGNTSKSRVSAALLHAAAALPGQLLLKRSAA